MKRLVFVAAFCAAWVASVSGGIDTSEILKRGDANNDGAVGIADGIFIASWLFLGGPEPPCMNQADANHDGDVDLTDVIYVNNFLFNGSVEIPSPGAHSEDCTKSDLPVIGCEAGCN